MSNALVAVGGASGAYDPENGMTCVLSVYINREKQFAFIEFRTVEEASNAMALDGVVMGGSQLRVRGRTITIRTQAALIGPTTPSDALNLAAVGLVAGPNGVPVVGAAPGMVPGIPSTQQSSGRKLYVGNLPPYLTELQVLELVQSFGKVQAFNLVVDKDTGALKGYGILRVRRRRRGGAPRWRASPACAWVTRCSTSSGRRTTPGAAPSRVGRAPVRPGSFPANGESASECVRLANMVTREELTTRRAREILEDTQEECARVRQARAGGDAVAQANAVGRSRGGWGGFPALRRHGGRGAGAVRSLNGRSSPIASSPPGSSRARSSTNTSSDQTRRRRRVVTRLGRKL